MDPTIQTFCCHHGNGTNTALTIMQEFNTDAYNSVCIFSSSLGILGAIYQVLPRQEFISTHRWISYSSTRGRKIIIWLAVADLLASLGVFLRSLLWISYKNIMPSEEDDTSVLFCAISSALTQYFYTATWIWTLCYAIDMRLVLKEKDSRMNMYHFFAWTIPSILTTTGLSLLYLPDANCHVSESLDDAVFRILPNYLATYIPITLVMVANPWLYCNSSRDMQQIITSVSGQFTSRERAILDAIKFKFFMINIVFYLCWFPNLLNGILLWTLWFHLPANWIIAIWYVMAFMNPLQALLNCMVYRRWSQGTERIIIPWRGRDKKVEAEPGNFDTANNEGLQSSGREEILPLLRTGQSINGYKRYLN